MKKRWRRLLLLGLFVVLVLIAARDLVVSPNRALNYNKQQDKTPDWFMTGAHGFTTDKQGNVKSQLHSPTLQHYASANVIHLHTPHFIVYDKKKIPWDITANSGDYYQNKPSYLHLVGNVIVKQLPAPGSQLTEIHTSVLNYYPQTNIAKTDQAVSIKQHYSTTHGKGMIANLKTSDIQFLSQSHTEYYDPPKKNKAS